MATREIQIKSTVRLHLIPTRTVTTPKTTTNAGEDMSGGIFIPFGGMQIRLDNTEISMEVLQKTELP